MSSSASEETKKIPFFYNLSIVNETLETLNLNTITQTLAKNPKAVNLKIEEIGQKIRDLLNLETPDKTVGERVMEQFTQNFDLLSMEDQYRVLTSMPRDESREFLQKTFSVNEHKSRRAKEIQEEQGLMSTPNPKPGKRISEEIIKIVQDFYEKDIVSRQMPGKKDCVSMVVNGVKEKVQKRQILCTIYEAFLHFKEEFPEVKIGFSKFAEARQKNVVLPGRGVYL